MNANAALDGKDVGGYELASKSNQKARSKTGRHFKAALIAAASSTFLFFTGCTAAIKELHKPPFPYTVIHHTRAVGIEATIPNQAGDSVLKFRLGWFSDAWHLIPCSTNQIYIPAIADSFKLGSEISFSPTTSIIEDLATGERSRDGPRYSTLFNREVKLRPITVNTNSP